MLRQYLVLGFFILQQLIQGCIDFAGFQRFNLGEAPDDLHLRAVLNIRLRGHLTVGVNLQVKMDSSNGLF